MKCKLSKKKSTDVIPWLSPDVRGSFSIISIHQQRSRQSRLNKVTGPKAGTRHIQGSVSASAIAKKMRKAGEIVTVAKLFSRTHAKAKDKIFADDRANAVWENQSLKMEKQVAPSQEDDSLFLEAVGDGARKALFMDSTKTELNLTKNKLQQRRTSMEQQRQRMEEQQRQLEQQQGMMEEHKHRIEKQQRMLKA
ncbi:hypothetical protein Cgig2_029730 [Carnegiea gigantea]|uniref:Uncharacterized protein n=1 Tax=Carnegiea gigantea TaxID=171969 RepID=A0A9Q1JKA5_9CARY|nr:hypothetical protein Cgig2_029730 [Carnegiea gigantea]